METTEQALVCAAQADPAAFDALYRLYVTRVYRYVRSHTTNNEDAADITQQVFLQALKALAGYTPKSSFGAWLFSIAHNATVDTQRHKVDTISWEHLPINAHPLDEQSPEVLALHHEATDRLQAVLQQLNSEKRELIALRFAAQLSITEIAVVVSKNPAAVKKHISRILYFLKEHLHDE